MTERPSVVPPRKRRSDALLHVSVVSTVGVWLMLLGACATVVTNAQAGGIPQLLAVATVVCFLACGGSLLFRQHRARRNLAFEELPGVLQELAEAGEAALIQRMLRPMVGHELEQLARTSGEAISDVLTQLGVNGEETNEADHETVQQTIARIVLVSALKQAERA